MSSLRGRIKNNPTKNERPFTTKRSRSNSKRSQSKAGMGFPNTSLSRNPAFFRIHRLARGVYVGDFFAVLVLFAVAYTYIIFFVGDSESSDNGLTVPSNAATVDKIVTLASSRSASVTDANGIEIGTLSPKDNYEQYYENAPLCRPLDDHEVTFTLVIALSEKDIEKMWHHCQRWGISAPISIAVWTDMSPQHVMEKLKAFKYNKCQPEQMSIVTLAPSDETSEAVATGGENGVPLNKLRNLAIQGIKTTHAFYLDVEMFPSLELFDILHSPLTVRELAKNPRLAIILPAFEVDPDHCGSRERCLKNVPGTFDALIMQLSEKAARVMGPYARQGSTLYRSWVRQLPGELVDIDCVSSDDYEPFLAFRYCEGLPPFQEVLRRRLGSSKDDESSLSDEDGLEGRSTWMLHLLRLGYSLKQLGGGFVIDLPTIPRNDVTDPQNSKAATVLRRVRKTKNGQRISRAGFRQWLQQAIPDHRVVQKCDDFEESKDGIG